MQNAIKEIQDFIPSCEQEEVDKKIFLEVLQSDCNCFVRENLLFHFTSSAWVMNETKTHALCAFHNIYQEWSWLGGHCDGDENFLRVIEKEITEESGIKDFRLYANGIFSLETMAVHAHTKNGKYVPGHIHLNVTYAFIADDKCATRIAEGENTDVAWKLFDELIKSQSHGNSETVYQKIADKIKRIELDKKLA